MKEVIPGPPEQPFQNGSRGADIFLRPEVSLLEFLDSHLIGSEDRVTHVIMGPVTVKDSSFLFQPLLKRGSRKGCENGEGGKFDIVLLDKFDRLLKNIRGISIKPEDEGPLNTNLMALNRFDPFRQFFCVDKSFRDAVQILLEKRLKTDEERDETALSGLFEELFIQGNS